MVLLRAGCAQRGRVLMVEHEEGVRVLMGNVHENTRYAEKLLPRVEEVGEEPRQLLSVYASRSWGHDHLAGISFAPSYQHIACIWQPAQLHIRTRIVPRVRFYRRPTPAP